MSDLASNPGRGTITPTIALLGSGSVALDRLVAGGGPERTPSVSIQREEPRVVYETESSTIAEKVFARVVELKVAFSQFAMHLAPGVRKAYFARIDDMAAPEAWDDRDALPSTDSFRDFLRSLIFFSYVQLPELALNSDGTFCACWYWAELRVTLEFLGDQRVRWIASQASKDDWIYGSGISPFKRLSEFVKPFASAYPIFR
jgi:hypothetical protein